MVGYSFARVSHGLKMDGRNIGHLPQAIRMRGVIVLLAFFFLAAFGAAAQDQPQNQSVNAISLASPASSGALGPVFAGFAPKQWQIAAGYQFNHIAIRGAFPSFSTFGVNASVVRYFGKTIGVEGDGGAGFGSAFAGTSLNSIFLGAGPHVVFRNRSHFEPWIHALGGAEHFDFGVPSPVKSTAAAWLLGGGFDYNFTNGFAVRIQADYLGSFFGGAYQRNVQIVSGVVWNF